MTMTRIIKARTGVFTLLALLGCGTVLAGAQILPLGEADKHGAINYSVKCEGGGSRIVQCVRDDQHCGYAGEQTLAAIVAQACGEGQSQVETPSTFETAPASP